MTHALEINQKVYDVWNFVYLKSGKEKLIFDSKPTCS